MELIELSCTAATGHTRISIAKPPIGPLESPFVETAAGQQVMSCLTLSSLVNDPTVRVTLRLRASPAPQSAVRIEGLPRGSSLLGGVLQADVAPQDWRNGLATVSIPIDATALRAAGVGAHRMVWDWHFGTGTLADAALFAVSELIVFATLSSPNAPWTALEGASAELTPPWPSALMVACDWARGAATVREAARMITRRVIDLGGQLPQVPARLRYAPPAKPRYKGSGEMPLWFDCELFIADLGGPPPQPSLRVNCVELTAVIATFSNLLGCALVPVIIDAPQCGVFRLNRLRPLGRTSGRYLTDFSNHLVAVEKGSASDLGDATVYDATALISPLADFTKDPPAWGKVDGLPLGRLSDPAGTGVYLPQLISAADAASCTLKETDPIRLVSSRKEGFDSCTLTRMARVKTTLPQPTLPDSPVLINPLKPTWSTSNIVAGAPSVEPAIPRAPDMPVKPGAVSVTYRRTPDGAPAVHVDQWGLNTAAQARDLMAEFLATSEIPLSPVATQQGVAYAGPGRQMVLWWIGRTVLALSSLNDEPVDLGLVSWQ